MWRSCQHEIAVTASKSEETCIPCDWSLLYTLLLGGIACCKWLTLSTGHLIIRMTSFHSAFKQSLGQCSKLRFHHPQ
jgi:hypothetical protein